MARNEKVLRLFVVVLATLCVIAFTPLMTSAQVSAKSKLTVDPSVTVVAGSTASVTAKGLSAKKLKKLTWTSKNAKIATVVTKKGKTTKIKGVAKGSTTVIGKSGKKKVTVKVTVLAKPAASTKTVEKTVEKYKGEDPDKMSVTGYYQGDATVYALLYQESAEVAAQQIQAYRLAKQNLDKAIQNNGGTGEGLAIVTDIDSTIADDTCYVAGAVLDKAGRAALGLDPWNNDDWDGYYEAVATTADTVIPGAKEFVDYAYQQGVEWYYITNRPYYELDLTVKQLAEQGFLENAKGGKEAFLDTYKVVEKWQDYFYYGDKKLDTYAKSMNDSGEVTIGSGFFTVKDDYRVQVQGTDFDSDKAISRANVAQKVGGRDKIVMYLGDSINDMVSDGEKDVWGDNTKDFTRKQFNEARTGNVTNSKWYGGTPWSDDTHWGNDFIVLPNATYGDWYKATWAKGKDPDNKYDSSTIEGQQNYIRDQIKAHSYKSDVNPKAKKWYDGPSPVGSDIQ